MKIVIVFGFILNLFAVANAECGACHSDTGFACANRNTVQICNGGQLTASTFVCPNGYVCLSGSADPCVNPQNNEFDCQEKCSGVCPDPSPQPGEDLLKYICLGPNSLKSCKFGFTYICPDGEVCTGSKGCAKISENNLPACSADEVVYPTETTSTPKAPITNVDSQSSSKTTETSTTSTPEVKLSPDQICEGKPNRSKYPLSPPDPFCKNYALCRLRGGSLATCPGRRVFDEVTRECVRGELKNCRTI